jgi:hypothetical protein
MDQQEFWQLLKAKQSLLEEKGFWRSTVWPRGGIRGHPLGTVVEFHVNPLAYQRVPPEPNYMDVMRVFYRPGGNDMQFFDKQIWQALLNIKGPDELWAVDTLWPPWGPGGRYRGDFTPHPDLLPFLWGKFRPYLNNVRNRMGDDVFQSRFCISIYMQSVELVEIMAFDLKFPIGEDMIYGKRERRLMYPMEILEVLHKKYLARVDILICLLERMRLACPNMKGRPKKRLLRPLHKRIEEFHKEVRDRLPLPIQLVEECLSYLHIPK